MTNATDATLLQMVRDRLATMFVPDRLAFMHRLVAGYCLECGVVEIPEKLCACFEQGVPTFNLDDPWPFPWPKPISHYDSDGPRGEPEDKPVEFAIGGVYFWVHPTGDKGCDTGRHRYEVRCANCTKVLHENTTGPSTRILGHLCEAHGRKRL